MHPFHNKASFYSTELLAPHQPEGWRTNPLPVRDCLYNIFAAKGEHYLYLYFKNFYTKPDMVQGD